jgi:hypothetical protein
MNVPSQCRILTCRILARVREERPVWPLERSLPGRSTLPLVRSGPSGANVVGRRLRRLSISHIHAGECQSTFCPDRYMTDQAADHAASSIDR